MKKYPNPIWTTQKNERKRLQSLTNLHLINCRRWVDSRMNDMWSDLLGDVMKDGFTLTEWRDMIDDEIARRVMLAVEDAPLCL